MTSPSEVNTRGGVSVWYLENPPLRARRSSAATTPTWPPRQGLRRAVTQASGQLRLHQAVADASGAEGFSLRPFLTGAIAIGDLRIVRRPGLPWRNSRRLAGGPADLA